MTQTFWDFSLSFYAQSSVEGACLELQDTHGADVNIVLFLLFQASRGQDVTAKEVSTIDGELRAWRDTIIQPLRKVRQDLRTPIYPIDSASQASLREQVKQLELSTEQLVQTFLASYLLSTPSPAASAVSEDKEKIAALNLWHYAASLGLRPDNTALTSLLKQFSTVS